jgi:hypothetical protein
MKIKSIIYWFSVVFILTGCGNTSNLTQSSNSTVKSKSYCLSKYRYQSSQSICTSYWKNSELPCDEAMREIINDRREDINSSSCRAGSFASPVTSKISPAATCQLVVKNMASKDICQQYFSNGNRSCDADFRMEISNRNQKMSPLNECGSSIVVKLFTPAVESESCDKFIRNLSNNSNPLIQACNVRHGIGDNVTESISCRKELNLFINANSSGVGKNFASCGAKLDTGIFDNNRSIKSFFSIAHTGPNGIQDYYKQFTSSNKSSCENLARQKDSDGLFCLYTLERIAKNSDAAFKYLFEAVDRGHPVAQFALHSALKDSNKPEQRAEAAELLVNSAIGGYSLAQINLGWSNMSVTKNYKKAMYWNLRAAESGDGEAASNVGLLYEMGWGVTKNIKTAIEWHEKAIRLGFSWSGQPEFHLAQIYEKGSTGIKRDSDEAIKLYRRIVNDLPRAEKKRKDIAISRLKILQK